MRTNAERYPLRFAARNGFRVHAGQTAGWSLTAGRIGADRIHSACGRVWSVPMGRALPPDTPVTCVRCLRRIGRPMKISEQYLADQRRADAL